MIVMNSKKWLIIWSVLFTVAVSLFIWSVVTNVMLQRRINEDQLRYEKIIKDAVQKQHDASEYHNPAFQSVDQLERILEKLDTEISDLETLRKSSPNRWNDVHQYKYMQLIEERAVVEYRLKHQMLIEGTEDTSHW